MNYYWELIEQLLLKSGQFRKWYKNKMMLVYSELLYDLELDEALLPREDLYKKKKY